MLATLWSAHAPLTAGEVQERLASTLAYSTVVTILSRLHAKGMLEREQHGRAFAYRRSPTSPASPRGGCARCSMPSPTGSQVLARFVSDLSDEDERLLRRLLGECPPPVRQRPAG